MLSKVRARGSPDAGKLHVRWELGVALNDRNPPVTSWESATPEAGGLTERRQPSRVGLVTGTKS